MRALAAFVIVAQSWSALAAETPLFSLEKRYLDGLFAAKPHLATFMGDHRFDGALPDLSPAALERREQQLLRQEKELEAIVAAGGLDADGKVDAQILRDGIALELLYLRDIRDWEWDPRLYDSFPFYDPREILGQRLSDIIHGDFAPAAERKRSVLAELAALPQFLSSVERSLLYPKGKRRTPKVYLEQAKKAIAGNIELFNGDVKKFVGDSPTFRAATSALEHYLTFLNQDMAGQAVGDWRLGAALYDQKFPLALQTRMTPDQLLPRARAAFTAARAELYERCKKMHQALWPKDPLSKEPNKVIQRVVDELAKDHPRPAELVAAHARHLDELRAFIEKHDLVSLPPKETLRVEPMPDFKRGSTAAEYLAPGVLIRDPSWHATYYVDPIDPTWPAEKVESYLRGQNDYQVELVSAHEAYPGHHVQYFHSKKNGDPLRAVLWNGPFAEGWAVYGEELLCKRGLGGDKNDRFMIFNLTGRMISATNTIIDIELQRGHMTDEEAVRFMVEEGFQPRAQAEKKLVRAKLDSTQLVQYFLGFDEIETLERDYRRKVGKKFSQRVFDEGLIDHGTIAVKFLRDYLLR